MNEGIAYAVAFLFIGAAGGIFGSLLSAAGAITKVGRPTVWAFVAGAIGAMLSYWLGLVFFTWLGVHFGWYSYLVSMVLMVLNDGRRAASEGPLAIGVESSHARGTMTGLIASITIHFLR
jgi:hypothetical protein